ncbi:Beta-lactamase [compost metagenome]
MSRIASRMLVAAATAVLAFAPGGSASASASTVPAVSPSPDMKALLDYLGQHHSTGFIVIEDGRVLIDETWPAPETDRVFANFVHGRTSEGALLEDVASQQKSFIAILFAIAIDKGLIDTDLPASTYLGQGWSKATPEQEARIRVIDLLTMSTGLDEAFGYTAPAGTVFFYNTPVYAMTKRILTAATGQSLEAITQVWLTGPVGMKDTAWRQRPAALAAVGNDTALVTTPSDVARLGQMVLHGGLAEDGARVVSDVQLHAMFERSATNPAYGRLWWLNGSDYTVRALAGRREGQLIPAGPADLVGAFGAFDRRLYVAPGRKLVVVRTGAAADDKDFDQQLWLRLMKVLDGSPASGSEH